MWLNNSCVAKCSDSNLAACTDEPRCTTSGMMWDNGAKPNKCLGTCSTNNPIACGETGCNGKGMTWAGGKCLGLCLLTNLVACNTLHLCQRDKSEGINSKSFWPGYWLENKKSCVNQCPDNSAITDAGCQTLALCSGDERWDPDTNTCSVIKFEDVITANNNIDNSFYLKPVLIEAGEHLVTTDATFADVVKIAPGARLVASTLSSGATQTFGQRNLVFAKTLYAAGSSETAATSIIFSVKNAEGETKGDWGSIKIKNAHDYRKGSVAKPFTHRGEYKFGTKLENVTFEGFDRYLYLSGYATNLQLSGQAILRGSDTNSGEFNEPSIYVENSHIPVLEPMSTWSPTYLVNNNIKRFQNWREVRSTFLWRNTIGDQGTASDTTTFGEYAVVAFNAFYGNVSCSENGATINTRIFGNKITGQTNFPIRPCLTDANSTESVSDKNLVIINSNDSIFSTPGFYMGSPTDIALTILNKDQFDTTSKVESEISYTTNNVENKAQYDTRTYSFKTDGSTPKTIKILTVGGITDLIGMISTKLSN